MASNYPFRLLAILCIFTTVISGCTHPEAYEVQQVNLATFTNTASQAETFVDYFDLDRNAQKLLLKSVRNTTPELDEVKIAINHFLDTTSFYGKYKSVKFQHYNYKMDAAEFYFSGKYEFNKKEDKDIFIKALKLTIAKYINTTNIDLIINGKTLK